MVHDRMTASGQRPQRTRCGDLRRAAYTCNSVQTIYYSYRVFVFWVQDPSVQKCNAGHIKCRHLLRELKAANVIKANVDVKTVLEARQKLDDGIQLRLRRRWGWIANECQGYSRRQNSAPTRTLSCPSAALRTGIRQTTGSEYTNPLTRIGNGRCAENLVPGILDSRADDGVSATPVAMTTLSYKDTTATPCATDWHLERLSTLHRDQAVLLGCRREET